MNCSNCGTQNNEGNKFCIKCGQSLINTEGDTAQQIQTTESLFKEETEASPSIEKTESSSKEETESLTNNTLIDDVKNIEINSKQSQIDNVSNTTTLSKKIAIKEYFFVILAVILKPFTSFKEELNKFNDLKKSAIMALIVSSISTLFNLITTMLKTVMVKNFDWSSGGYKTTWVWENLKKLNYFEVIGKNFLIYLGVILAIAAIYYIASLIIKKQTNFSRLLGISTIAVVPMFVCIFFLSPLLGIIWADIAMPITIIGAVYTILLLYETMNSEVLLDGNVKYYFNLVCFSILGIAAYYLYMKLFMNSISGDIGNIMDLFGGV